MLNIFCIVYYHIHLVDKLIMQLRRPTSGLRAVRNPRLINKALMQLLRQTYHVNAIISTRYDAFYILCVPVISLCLHKTSLPILQFSSRQPGAHSPDGQLPFI